MSKAEILVGEILRHPGQTRGITPEQISESLLRTIDLLIKLEEILSGETAANPSEIAFSSKCLRLGLPGFVKVVAAVIHRTCYPHREVPSDRLRPSDN